LNRYDGSSCKVFRSNPGDSVSLSDNYILAIYLAPDNFLFIHTRNGDVFYNPLQENFLKADKYLSALGLPATGLSCIQTSKDNYWFAYLDGRIFHRTPQGKIIAIDGNGNSHTGVMDMALTKSRRSV